MSNVAKGKLYFDVTDLPDSDQVASFLYDSLGNALTSTLVSGKQALDVNLVNSITVNADLNGIYNVGTNPNPDNVGIVRYARNAAPGLPQQTFLSTGGSPSADGIVSANVFGDDSIAFNMGYNGTTWDRLLSTSGQLQVLPNGNVADDGVDTGNPVKVGSRAISGALPAISTTGDRADLLSDMYRRLYINDSPNIAAANVSVTVDTTAGGIALPTSALAGRRRMLIQNKGNKSIFVGQGTVTSANGLEVTSGSTMSLEIGQNIALKAIAASGSQDTRVFELA